MTADRTPAARHATWLSLVEPSGPFLSASVLADSDGFRQGLPRDDNEPTLRATFASYYTQWLDNRDRSRPDPAIDRAWIEAVVHDVLEWNGFTLEGQSIPPGLTLTHGETRDTVSPDLVLRDDEGRNRLLLKHYPAHQDLTAPITNSRWVESPAIRMVALLQETEVRLGLVTNGETWLLVSAPTVEPPGFATWLVSLWFEEHETFTAFRTLLGIQRFVGVPEEETLERLLDRSAEDQSGVTTRLGDQVRQAIELLVEGIDREDETRNGALLAEVPDEQVYEAAIAVMMRLVFILYAEDQQPPLIGGLDATYEESYSVAGLIERLETVEEAVLEQRRDAWPRLLATFRLVHSGSDHDRMRQPAYGGSLFDPDRFPFLEGRQRGSSWRDAPAQPLPITNRTVLHMLQAIQFLENRGGRERISFRAIDVEQIGHIYEQLLEHTARRADGPVLGFSGTKRKEPEIALADLEAWREAGEAELLKRLKEATGRSETALKRLLAAQPDPLTETALRRACHNEDRLVARVRPFATLIRKNRARRPVVIHPGGLYVTAGNDRGTTGAHYTPRTLTEPIVQYTLEPLVYDGPAEGKPREEWRLLPPKAILDLNVCDPAMGSGAFLVQACRWLAERLVESWTAVADAFGSLGKPLAVMADGSLSREAGHDATLLPVVPAERLAIARRMVADHCLYGVDVNPLAVDMAKLSLWLVTLQQNRPFTFLDHRLRTGDSLLGLRSLDQLRTWSFSGEADKGRPGFTTQFDRQVTAALDRGIELHRRIEEIRVLDVHDIER